MFIQSITKEKLRLSYCDNIFRTKPLLGEIKRNPLRVGVELFGAKGIDAEAETVYLSVATWRLFIDGLIFADIRHVNLLKRILENLSL